MQAFAVGADLFDDFHLVPEHFRAQGFPVEVVLGQLADGRLNFFLRAALNRGVAGAGDADSVVFHVVSPPFICDIRCSAA